MASSRIADAARALMGMSAYSPLEPQWKIPDEQVVRIRESMGGQIQRMPVTQARWFIADLERAWIEADQGQLSRVGQLWRAMKRDGYIGGLTQTRTAGLVALRKLYRGDQRAVDALRAENETRSVFDEMFPPQELALLAGDGLGVGVGVAELLPVPGRTHPVMQRLDPEGLWYKWNENRWYFNGVAGAEPVIPGNGRWILHTPGGRLNPWHTGLWPTLGRSFILKEHAMLGRGNFAGKLANPARVAFAPQAATESQKQAFFQRLLAWGYNTVFGLPAGWDVKILESNGRGFDVFGQEIDTSNQEIMIALAGQFVTVSGGTGFSNATIHETIRADLIKLTADALAHTINTQGIPPWEYVVFGQEIFANTARVEWDISPPAKRADEAKTLADAAKAITDLTNALRPFEKQPNVQEISSRFGIPTLDGAIELPEPKDPALPQVA